jgi:protein involved in sex pheromone biosynthesis
MGLMLSAVLLAAILFLSGCASNRYLSEEQDAQMREACEATGCAVIPGDKWEQIKKLLGSIVGA